MSLFVIIQRQFQGSKLTKYKKDESGKNHHHWSTIGDPHGCLVGDPHIFILNNQIFFGDPRFSLETPYFRWIPNIFVGDPQILAGVSTKKMGSPMKILGSSMKIWQFPRKILGSPTKIWRSSTRRLWGLQ